MKAGALTMAAVAVVAVLVTTVGIATARAPATTTIVDQDVSCGINHPDPEICGYFGWIESSKRKCLANRKVKIFRLLSGGGREQVDTARTSSNGAYGGLGPSSEVSASAATVTARKVGRTRCKADSFQGA